MRKVKQLADNPNNINAIKLAQDIINNHFGTSVNEFEQLINREDK